MRNNASRGWQTNKISKWSKKIRIIIIIINAIIILCCPRDFYMSGAVLVTLHIITSFIPRPNL